MYTVHDALCPYSTTSIFNTSQISSALASSVPKRDVHVQSMCGQHLLNVQVFDVIAAQPAQLHQVQHIPSENLRYNAS